MWSISKRAKTIFTQFLKLKILVIHNIYETCLSFFFHPITRFIEKFKINLNVSEFDPNQLTCIMTFYF